MYNLLWHITTQITEYKNIHTLKEAPNTSVITKQSCGKVLVLYMTVITAFTAALCSSVVQVHNDNFTSRFAFTPARIMLQ